GPILLRTFNSACLSAGTRGDRTYLGKLLTRVDTIHSLTDLPAVLASFHEVGVGALFAFCGARDLMNPGQVIATIGVGGTGLPDRSYYLEAASAPVRSAYRAH